MVFSIGLYGAHHAFFSVIRFVKKALVGGFVLVSLLHAQPVVNLKGEMNVNQGALEYTFNLQLPPGIAGVVPKLSLTYNSNGGNGYLGKGWDLGGLSSITRCGSTIADDGISRSIQLDEKDHYCLDGQRLVAVAGAEGADGTEYRTKIESYSRIVSYGGNGDNPQTFKVWTKSGDVYEYGAVPNARFDYEGKTVSWKVSKIRDALLNDDNAIEFVYTDEHVISSVNYANGINRIDFLYGTGRLDKRKANYRGKVILQDKNLEKILVSVNGTDIREYRLSYLSQSNSRDLLKLDSIRECVENECLEPLSFTWDTNVHADLQFNKLAAPLITSDSYKFKIADFNGDGISDIYKVRDDADHIFIMNAEGGIAYETDVNVLGEYDAIALVDFNGDGIVDIYERYRPLFSSHTDRIWINDGEGHFTLFSHPDIKSALKRIKFADIDDDSDMDIYELDSNGHDKIWINDGRGNFEQNGLLEIKLEDCVESVSDSKIDTRIAERDIAFYDADEDGDLDIFIAVPVRSSMFLKRFIVNIYRNDGNGAFSLLRSDITHAPSTVNDDEDTLHQFVELNGDGIPDIVHIETSNSTTQSSYIYLSDCNLHWNTQPLAIASSKKKIRLADLNGDGVTDIYHTYKNNSGIWINDGKGNFSLDPNDQNINKSDDSYKSIDIVDLDGDGIVDIVEKGLPLFLEPRENNLWLNDGMGSFSAFRISQAKIDFSYTDEHFNVLYGDFNGDGLVDIYDTKTGIYLNANKQEKIVAITDSFKNVINITYDTLANNELYTKENDVKEKEVNLQTSAAVVASTEVGNGIGGIQKMSYRYSGLKYHLMRGPLGFRTVETTDETTGAKTLTEFYQAYPLTGRAKRTQSFIGDEILSDSSAQAEILILINGSWSIADNPSSLANRPDRYIIQNHSEEMKSFINDILLKETLTEYKEYDEYGNVEEMRVTTTGGGETFVKTTISSYENIVDGEKWLPGRLTNVSVTHEGYGDTKTRTSSFSYNEYGMLQSETIEPDDALELTKSYTYDRFGNKIQEKLSSSSVAEDRIASYTYDDNGRFIVKVTNALGQEENSLYDENEGKRVSLTGPNGLSTRWEYNEWGQLTKEVRADGTFTTMSYTYDNSQNNSLYVITKSSSDGKTESIYYDSFDRVVATKTIGFEGEEIFVETSYNAKGQVEAKSSPHSLNDENVGYIRYIYDTYGRVTETLTPPHNTGDTGEISTKAEYDGYEVKTIDAENREKIVKKDAMDKIVSVQEGESSMEYSYDAIGNLVKTVPNGDETRAILMEYDILGNKTKMADPNMGTWTYTYNALGEPVSQKDAKAQTTTMHYDRLGRLTEKKTPEGTSVRQYDLGQKAIGKLSYESSGNISKAYAYDEYGRPASVTTAIDGLTYSEAYVYNEKGQLEAVTKPNNFKLVNTYNAYGYLESIKSPREQILDFDFDHYVNLIAALLQRATEYQTLYMEYQAKADELKAKAGYYESVAQANEAESAYFNEVAVQLRAAAAQYEASAEINRHYADRAKAQADKYQALADKYAKSIFTRSQSYTYQKLADRYYADTRHYLELAQQYALDAQNALDTAQGDEEQAQQLARNAESSINLAQDALALMQEDLARAEHYQRLAENNTQMSEAYNEMLADEENVYHYKVLSMDSFGRVTQYLSGNGLINTDSYDDSGAMLGSQTGFLGDNAIRDLSYEYDKTYNLAKRTDSYLGVTAEYTYDALSRIEHARFVFENGQNITGMSDMSYAYDAFGNITHKSDIGEYAYDDALHPNRLSSVYNADTGETKTFEYDANGNMVNDNGIIITYNSDNKPVMIKEGANTVYFAYDMNGERYQKTQNGYTATYIGKGYEHIEYTDGSHDEKQLIYANGKVVAVNTDHYEANDATLATPSIRYLHYDALGSVDTITDNKGTVLERRAYKPFGEELEVYKDPDAGFTTNRGFTGHEHIEGTRLIHMNARLYDPMLGRFLSADPIIQDPYDTQSYNRYSYVRNNPLKYTDPSGHSWLSKIFKTLIQIIVAVVAYAVFGPASTFVGNLLGFTGMGLPAVGLGAAMGATMGFAATLINGGSLSNAFGSMLKGALFGAISAGIANEIGNWAEGLEGVGDGHSLSFFTEGSFVPALAKAAMHGIARGVIDTIQGGKFGAGFASGFVSSGFAVSQKWGTVESRTIVMAVVGGTTSQITGGKFANGAITGAFVHLFNAEAVISSTYRAVKHYFNGSGDMVELASETKLELVNSPEVRAQSQALRNGAAKVLNGNFGVELMWDTFHVGDTGVVFNTYCSSSICTTSYVGFVQVLHGGSVATSPDSFSDPIDMGFELYGGKPYYYMPHSWTETYPNKF